MEVCSWKFPQSIDGAALCPGRICLLCWDRLLYVISINRGQNVRVLIRLAARCSSNTCTRGFTSPSHIVLERPIGCYAHATAPYRKWASTLRDNEQTRSRLKFPCCMRVPPINLTGVEKSPSTSTYFCPHSAHRFRGFICTGTAVVGPGFDTLRGWHPTKFCSSVGNRSAP